MWLAIVSRTTNTGLDSAFAMPGPSLSEVFQGIQPPFFVRKVGRPTHWESPQDILDNVFAVDDDGTISVWRIENDIDLSRVAVALNSNSVRTNPRGASLKERILLVAILPEEAGNIKLQQNNGLTDCSYANQRHYGAVIDADVQRESLVNALLTAGRSPSRLTRNKMQSAIDLVEADGCYAVVEDSEHCECGFERS